MSLNKEAVLKLGRLARIALEDEQAVQIAGELSNVLEWIEQLQEVDVSNVAPMTSVLEAYARTRADELSDGAMPERVLSNAPQEMKGYYVVPKVIE